MPTASPTAASSSNSDSSPKVVKYTGDAGVREITRTQWKGAGVENQDTTIWNAENDYTLPISDFNSDALETLKRDRHIKVS